MHLVTTFTIYNEIQVVLYFWQKKKKKNNCQRTVSLIVTCLHSNKRQSQKWPNKQVYTRNSMCWHWKWASSSTLPYTRNYVNHKNRKNSTITKVPNSLSLSLSLSSRLSSLVFLAGPKAKTVFFLSHFALPRRKTRSLSLCVSHFVHIVCYHNWEKKLRRDLRLLWGTRLIPFFFFSKAFLTGNGFWVFFVYTFCLLGSDSFVLVYCCCSWKSILTKSLTKDTNFIWFVLYHWICYCFFF